MNNLSKIKVLTSILFIAFFLNGCSGTDDEQNTVSLRVIDSSYSGVAKELTLDKEDYSVVNISIIRIELTGDDTVVVFKIFANNFNNSSPAWWPNESLTSFKPSKSADIILIG